MRTRQPQQLLALGLLHVSGTGSFIAYVMPATCCPSLGLLSPDTATQHGYLCGKEAMSHGL